MYRGDKTYIYHMLANIAEVASAKRDKAEEIKKKQMTADPTKKLRVATIFSYGANEEEEDGILDEENSEDTSALD